MTGLNRLFQQTDTRTNLIDPAIQPFIDFLFNLLYALIIIAVYIIVIRLLRRYVFKIASRTSKNVNLATLLTNLTTLVALFLCVVSVITIFTGAGFQTLFTVLGFIGAGIAVSLQDVFRNLVAGIYILIERPFGIGDVIRVKDVEGEVEAIEYRATTLKTETGVRLIVPNGIIFSEVVTHRSVEGSINVVYKLVIPVDFGLTATAKKVNEVVSTFKEGKVMEKPAPQIFLENTQDKILNVRLELWLKQDNYMLTKSELANTLRKNLPDVAITVL